MKTELIFTAKGERLARQISLERKTGFRSDKAYGFHRSLAFI